MSWFYDITQNPHIDVALLVDSTGKLVATTNRVGSEAQRVASMIKAAEVLARGLAIELGRGEMHTMQLSTKNGHLIVMPAGSAHYLIVLTNRDAPLETVTDEMQRMLGGLQEDDLKAALQRPVRTPFDDLDIAELIDAVTTWLHSLPPYQDNVRR
ncbi:MAG TPA: roadblock/LC7 domain-containing protein [Aggregatilineales bacterium]|nr:roadblock/LC7 domain-containing protein [Aggregatilineales bacterium]